MATYTGNKYAAGIPAITGDGKGDVIAVNSRYTHPTASTKLTDGDIIQLAKIPAGHEIVDLMFYSEDLDGNGSPALVVDVGLLTHADHAALDTVLISGSTLGQAGGTLGVPVTTTLFTTGAATADKVLAIEVTTSAGTKSSSDAVIGCIVKYAPV
jgi:hypothetical protein